MLALPELTLLFCPIGKFLKRNPLFHTVQYQFHKGKVELKKKSFCCIAVSLSPSASFLFFNGLDFLK